MRKKDEEVNEVYRLEASKAYNGHLVLVCYRNEVAQAIDYVRAAYINNYCDAWKFIEDYIGSSTKCEFDKEAIDMIFDL